MRDGNHKNLLKLCIEAGYCRDTVIQMAARVFEAAQEGICMTTPDGEINYVNPAFTQTTGYTLEEAVGKNPRILKSGLHKEDFYQTMWRDLTEKGQWQGEIWNKRKTGELYPETLAIHAVYNENLEVSHYFAIFHDISTDMQMRKEIELAGQIQRKILRSDFVHQRLCMKSIFLPYNYLSGDSYDYRWNKDNQVFNGFLFDVMGHGIASSLQASALRAIYRYVASKKIPLAEKMHWLNHESRSILSEEFFAGAMLFDIDVLQGTLTYCTAGINQFLIGRQHEPGLRKISKPGLFLGISSQEEYEQHEVKLQPEDGLLFLTDGFMDFLEDKKVPLQHLSLTSLLKLLETPAFTQGVSDDATALGFILQTQTE